MSFLSFSDPDWKIRNKIKKNEEMCASTPVFEHAKIGNQEADGLRSMKYSRKGNYR
jgi:hypothetical protein